MSFDKHEFAWEPIMAVRACVLSEDKAFCANLSAGISALEA